MGLFDAISAQTPQGEQLRSGLLGLGMGLLQGSTGNYGQFGPALAQGFGHAAEGMQQTRKYQLIQAEEDRRKAEYEHQQYLRGLQSNMVGRLARGGAQPMSSATGKAGTGTRGETSTQPLGLSDYQSLMAAGVPGAREAFEAFKYSQQGIERKSGNTYIDPATGQERYMPRMAEGIVMQGGHAMAVPGYAQANASIQGAQAGATTAASESAKYPYTVGAMREEANLDPVKVVGTDGNEYYAPRSQVAGRQGGVGAPMVAARNPVVQGSAIELNNNFIKNDYQPTLDSGSTAREMVSNLNALRSIDLKTGWGTEAKANAANFLVGLGVSSEGARQYASDAQKFQSIAMTQVNKVLNAAKGPQTEGDAQRAQKTFTSLRNTPQANAFIMDYAQAVAGQQARKAAYYQKMLPYAQKEGDLTKLGREWAKIQGSIWDDPAMAQYKGGQ